jgi:hypothetical protein
MLASFARWKVPFVNSGQRWLQRAGQDNLRLAVSWVYLSRAHCGLVKTKRKHQLIKRIKVPTNANA